MLDRLNLLANAVMTLASATFYLMIFTKAAPGFDASKHFRPRSYWTVRVGLSFFAAGSFLATLTMYPVSLPQLIRNVGTAILFAWAAAYHAKKWGVIAAPKRTTSSIPVIK
jgi:hypothetical protein